MFVVFDLPVYPACSMGNIWNSELSETLNMPLTICKPTNPCILKTPKTIKSVFSLKFQSQFRHSFSYYEPFVCV